MTRYNSLLTSRLPKLLLDERFALPSRRCHQELRPLRNRARSDIYAGPPSCCQAPWIAIDFITYFMDVLSVLLTLQGSRARRQTLSLSLFITSSLPKLRPKTVSVAHPPKPHVPRYGGRVRSVTNPNRPSCFFPPHTLGGFPENMHNFQTKKRRPHTHPKVEVSPGFEGQFVQLGTSVIPGCLWQYIMFLPFTDLEA